MIRVFRPQILHEYAFMASPLGPMNRLAAALLEEAPTHFREQAEEAQSPALISV